MAINRGQSTQTVTTEDHVWQFQVASPKGQNSTIEVFYEFVQTYGDGTVQTTPNHTPIRLDPQALGSLALFVEVPSELESLLPDPAAIEQILALLPTLITLACDAAVSRDFAEKEDQRLSFPQPNYFGFYSALLSEALNLFLFVRDACNSSLIVANSYGDLKDAIQFQQLQGFQSSISNLVGAMAATGHGFSPEQTAQMRSLLDANGFSAVVFPLG